MAEPLSGQMSNSPCKRGCDTAFEPTVIAIAGRSGSGKTTFAKRLAARLAPDAVVISHDDYYKHSPDMTPEEAAVYNFDDPSALDTWLLAEHLRTLKSGKSVDVPSYNFVTYARDDAARHIEPVRFILVEGLFILCDPTLRSLFDLTVFIDVDSDVCVLRRIERDCQERGTNLSRAIRMYLTMVKPAQEQYIDPFKESADIVIEDARSDAELELVARAAASAPSPSA